MGLRLALLAGAALVAANVAAASGGGGGGGSAPSSSGPSYDPVAEYQSGLEHLKQGEYKDAEKAFKRVTRVATKDANSHYLLGLSHVGQEEWRPAIRALRKTIRLDADMYDARAQLAQAYRETGKHDDASEQVAALEGAKTACAGTCADAGAIDAALAAAASAPAGDAVDTSALAPGFELASSATGDAAYLDAVRLINRGEYDAAKAMLGEAQAAFGPHPDVLTYLGFANRKQGRYDDAVGYYSAALAVDPDHLGANEYLGEYYVELGDLEAARGQLETLEALCPFGCAEATELKRWIDQSAS